MIFVTFMARGPRDGTVAESNRLARPASHRETRTAGSASDDRPLLCRCALCRGESLADIARKGSAAELWSCQFLTWQNRCEPATGLGPHRDGRTFDAMPCHAWLGARIRLTILGNRISAQEAVELP